MPNQSGVWTLQQQLQAKAQGLWPINGPFYVEEMFSTYLYKGNDATQTVTNGIDLAGKGGLVWIKNRGAITNHRLYSNGLTSNTYNLVSNASTAQADTGEPLAFANNGWSITGSGNVSNNVSFNYTSWTFRKQPKFFDVVTYTGDGTSDRLISHNLSSVPGCVIVKCTSTARPWSVAARADDSTYRYLALQDTGAQVGSNLISTYATSTTFNLTAFTNGGQPLDNVNTSSQTYVAYFFAHNAGGFGTSGNDNVISCGSYAGNNGLQTVNLGYEAQWVLIKNVSGAYDWSIYDNMRGMVVGSVNNPVLYPNTTAAEAADRPVYSTSTGFAVNTAANIVNASGNTYIYIAVRRGPMKIPTSATTVFGISARTGTGANATVTGGSGVDDAVLVKNRGAAVADLFASRLTGTGYLVTSSTAAEVAAGVTILQANPWDVMDGVKVGTTSTITNASANTFVNYLFSRAPGFFDVICYTGTGTVTTVSHNLQAVPELLIFKKRDVARSWTVVHANAINRTVSQPPVYTGYEVSFDISVSGGVGGVLNSTAPTSSVITLGNTQDVNGAGATYVAWLLSTVAGVSKVGSYTGTAALQTVACGFAAGARFVLIKRSDADGDWYYWDSVRGLSSGNDPYLLLNTAAAEVTGTNYVDTDTTGFKVTAAAPAALNAVGGTYIFLAIA